MNAIIIFLFLLFSCNSQLNNGMNIKQLDIQYPSKTPHLSFRDSILEKYSTLLIQFEGQPGAWKYVEANKFDKGGENNMGLTFTTYECLCKIVLNVEPHYVHFCALAPVECGKFIKWHYETMRGDSVDLALAILLTENAWLSGVQCAKNRLQSTLLHKFGVRTNSYDEALEYCKTQCPNDIVDNFTKERKEVVFWTCQNDITQNVFRYGWIRRIEELHCFIYDNILENGNNTNFR